MQTLRTDRQTEGQKRYRNRSTENNCKISGDCIDLNCSVEMFKFFLLHAYILQTEKTCNVSYRNSIAVYNGKILGLHSSAEMLVFLALLCMQTLRKDGQTDR